MHYSNEEEARLRRESAFAVLSQSGRGIELEPIPAELLISPGFWGFSRDTIFADGLVEISLHVNGGPTSIGGGAFGTQTIESLAIPETLQDFLNQTINHLDAIVAVDFSVRTDGLREEVNFYLDQEIVINTSSETILGIALSNYDDIQGGWWETILNTPAFAGDHAYMQYASLHELGHAFGLEHPFEASDGDIYKSPDPWSSAYPEQTVMAYRSPLSGEWPSFYSISDLEALINLLGKERQVFGHENNIINGADYSEMINGSRGDDMITGGGGNDDLYGGKDNDLINGNLGNDFISGNMGQDALWGGKGNDTIYGGKDNDRLFGDQGNDWLKGDTGNDQLTGGLGSDTFALSPGVNTIFDFNPNEGDWIAIPRSVSIEIYSLESGTIIKSNEGILALHNLFLDTSSLASRILWT